jgi:hypothetical protein
LTCSECALDIASRRAFRRLRVSKRWLVCAGVLLLGSHLLAGAPEIRDRGWITVVPSSIMVVVPSDIDAWADELFDMNGNTVDQVLWNRELTYRLSSDDLWAWQERILLSRVERACMARADYGITQDQCDMAMRIETTRTDSVPPARFEQWFEGAAKAADVPLILDRDSLRQDGWLLGATIRPTQEAETVAESLNSYQGVWSFSDYIFWDITPDGLFIGGPSSGATTVRTRIYRDLADLCRHADGLGELTDVITEMVEPDCWIGNGGDAGAMFVISESIVVRAPTRVHLAIEVLLDELRTALSATSMTRR